MNFKSKESLVASEESASYVELWIKMFERNKDRYELDYGGYNKCLIVNCCKCEAMK